MKIGLNGQMLTRTNMAGPEQFTLNLYKNLAIISPTTEFIIYFENIPSNELVNTFSLYKNITYKVLKKQLSWTQISLFLELIKNPIDVFFTPFHTIPALQPFFTKTVCMIHGFEYKLNEEYKRKPLHKLIHPIILWWTIFMSHRVIVSSHRVYKEMKNFTSNIKKVSIIPEGISNDFYKRSKIDIDAIKRKYKISGKYLFFLSTIQPRKNLPNTIQAVKDSQDITLVVAGKLGWEYEESVKAMEENKGRVIYIGRIPDEDRPALYSGCEAFINCSLDEGFGLPLLEAIACEAKAIVSDIPAFKEIAKEYATYVNPTSIASIKEGILESLSQPSAPIRAREISKSYSWEQTAVKYLDVFKSI